MRIRDSVHPEHALGGRGIGAAIDIQVDVEGDGDREDVPERGADEDAEGLDPALGLGPVSVGVP